MKLAFLYAGQGTQHPGMGRDLYETYPAFRQVLDSAQLDFDLKELCFEGPEENLSPDPVHPALHGGLCRRGDGGAAGEGNHPGGGRRPEPGRVLRPPGRRGVRLQDGGGAGCLPGESHGPGGAGPALRHGRGADAGPGAAAGVLPCRPERPVWWRSPTTTAPPSWSSPGDAAAVEKAGELALQAGAKRVVPLKVSGPFHTSLMAPAGEALAEKFQQRRLWGA